MTAPALSPTAPTLSKLQQALAKVREQYNPSTTSDDTTPTSLETYIRLYNKAGKECYTDYMQGAKELYKYLSPIEIPAPEHIPEHKLKHSLPSVALLHGYEIQQLALILSGDTGYKNPQFKYIQSLAVYYTAKHILGD